MAGVGRVDSRRASTVDTYYATGTGVLCRALGGLDSGKNDILGL